MRLVLLHAAIEDATRPDELDVLDQLDVVEAALSKRGHVFTRVAVDLDLGRLVKRLRSEKPDLVFNLVESLGGSDRLAHLAPAVVESLGIACTGASSLAIAETTDKLRTKRRLAQAGLPTPAWISLGDGDQPANADPTEVGRWIVKRIHEDASLDLDDSAVVASARLARARLERMGPASFAELFVEGREFNLGLLEGSEGPQILPLSEILFEDWPTGKPRIVGYAAKWQEDSFEASHTPRRLGVQTGDRELATRLAELAGRCWELLGLRGWARVDFRVDAGGTPWILEVNCNPCLSLDAGFMAASQNAGLTSHDVIERIIASAARTAPLQTQAAS